MAISKTKYQASEAEIKELFSFHRVGNVIDIVPLGNGEFNAAYRVTCDNDVNYALKVAPPEDAKVLSYENNMMESEVFWYSQMQGKTDILCPKVYVSDFSKNIIKSNCFIMEMMEGGPLWEMNFSDEEYEAVQEQKISMLSKIHRITNDKFGYVQMGLMPSWYEALRKMASQLVTDCKNIGHDTPDGERFTSLIDKYEQLLRAVPCRMVNFDLWDSNVLYLGESLAWIDPERSFWGDPVADFITLGKGQKTPLDEKIKEIEIYNKYASEKISAGREECIRYAAAVAYLALIEEVEKYVRYEPDEPNYIRNTVDARDMYDMAFAVMDAE